MADPQLSPGIRDVADDAIHGRVHDERTDGRLDVGRSAKYPPFQPVNESTCLVCYCWHLLQLHAELTGSIEHRSFDR